MLRSTILIEPSLLRSLNFNSNKHHIASLNQWSCRFHSPKPPYSSSQNETPSSQDPVLKAISGNSNYFISKPTKLLHSVINFAITVNFIVFLLQQRFPKAKGGLAKQQTQLLEALLPMILTMNGWLWTRRFCFIVFIRLSLFSFSSYYL